MTLLSRANAIALITSLVEDRSISKVISIKFIQKEKTAF